MRTRRGVLTRKVCRCGRRCNGERCQFCNRKRRNAEFAGFKHVGTISVAPVVMQGEGLFIDGCGRVGKVFSLPLASHADGRQEVADVRAARVEAYRDWYAAHPGEPLDVTAALAQAAAKVA